jgi:hypothetical protein
MSFALASSKEAMRAQLSFHFLADQLCGSLSSLAKAGLAGHAHALIYRDTTEN